MNKSILALADFLIARIEEDEEAGQLREMAAVGDIFEQGHGLPATRDATSPFAPPRVLIDCDVKLRMVRKARRAIQDAEIVTDTFGGSSVSARVERALYLQASASWSTVLRYMGLVYAHHPDYREEWKL